VSETKGEEEILSSQVTMFGETTYMIDLMRTVELKAIGMQIVGD